MQISLIVPTYNERRRIARCLHGLERQPVREVIVVDGQSPDGTAALARAEREGFPVPLKVLSSAPGRARQMNLGAERASGDVLWFVHADVTLADDAVHWIRRILARPRHVAGAFKTRTEVDPDFVATRWWQQYARHWLRLADFRSRYTHLPYGDQALFVRRQAFEQLGGFPAIALLEDLEFSRRLWQLGKIGRADALVHVSGRRFLEHPIVDTALVNLFPLAYRCGVSPDTLSALYRNTR